MLDAESELITEPSGVAPGSGGFMQDAVGAQGLGIAGKVEGEEHPADADGFVAVRAAEVG